jgi:hypothetical protein
MYRTLVRTLALLLAAVGLMVPVTTTASAAPDNFTPRSGPTFNSPVGDASAQRAIFRKIMRSINSSPRGSNINIFSWNFLTSEGKDALLRAQRRGVRVRLLMDKRNLQRIDNPPFRRLRAGLQQGNRRVEGKRRSWARVCEGTCRGGGGSAHSKFFMFSEVGKARKVVMQGSANFTVASSTNQWNDIYTHAGNRAVWDFVGAVFGQAARDKRTTSPYAARSFKDFRLLFFPNVGRNSPDPVMQTLNRVKCQGATNTGSGRTRIRIAPDVIRQDRGMRLARKLRQMWQNGCDIRIGYTVVGIKIGRMLRSDGGRGPVPMKHLVQDFDGDGQFDNYFHLKSMSIVGNYGGDRSNHLLLNGSANWSGLAKVSDENLGVYRNKGRVLRYQKHINYWYENFPSNGGRRMGTSERVVSDDRLVFGTDEDAVYEDGESVTDGTFDPFATMPVD